MSRVCKITGKKPLVGNNVSKSHRRTKRRQFPNLQLKRIFVPEIDKMIQLKLSASAIKTIDRVGLVSYLKKKGLGLSDLK